MEERIRKFQHKKIALTILHVLFILMTAAGISAMYLNSNFGEGISWVKNVKYEDSAQFHERLVEDMERIFTYVGYKDVFETDGELDMDKVIVGISDGPGDQQELTLDEIIRYMKRRGYYLGEDFSIQGSPMSMDDDGPEYLVDWQSYNPNFLDADMYSNVRMTKEELSFDVLNHLGDYYSIYYNYIDVPTNLHFKICYRSNEGEERVYTNAAEMTVEDMKESGKYLYIPGESIHMESNLEEIPMNVAPYLEMWNPFGNNKYYMAVAVDTDYPNPDAYAAEAAQYAAARSGFTLGMAGVVIGLIGSAATILFLLMMSGRLYSGSTQVRLYPVDETSTEAGVVIWALLVLVCVYMGRFIASHLITMFFTQAQWSYWIKLIKMLVVYGCTMVCAFSAVRRYKARTLWKNSLLRRAKRFVEEYLNHAAFASGIGICFLGGLAANWFLIWGMMTIYMTEERSMDEEITFFLMAGLLVAIDVFIFYRMFIKAVQRDQLDGAIRQISGGNTGFHMDVSHLTGKEKAMGEHINNIGTGLEAALKEQVKSERLKTDLITNVSHDIKTPLTSIINYVDLIKREHIQDPKVQGYLDVLEQKSQRLKTLTEDLVEASKASSGNLKLDIHDIDMVELVQQTNGEFEEKFSLRHLELVSNLPGTTAVIRADGRRLWRVLENLYNNTYKYAMENSRVYVDVAQTGSRVRFTMKNVSENPLNISPDELTERFVRGDVARSTEGSGLGLSIAKSLTQLQGGEFAITIDGDLFKVQVSFPIKWTTVDDYKMEEEEKGDKEGSEDHA